MHLAYRNTNWIILFSILDGVSSLSIADNLVALHHLHPDCYQPHDDGTAVISNRKPSPTNYRPLPQVCSSPLLVKQSVTTSQTSPTHSPPSTNINTNLLKSCLIFVMIGDNLVISRVYRPNLRLPVRLAWHASCRNGQILEA